MVEQEADKAEVVREDERRPWTTPHFESMQIGADTLATSVGPPHTDGANSVS